MSSDRNSTALASLTATYTDSEGEAESDDEGSRDELEVTTDHSTPTPHTIEERKPTSRLVSSFYNNEGGDDELDWEESESEIVVSDDEFLGSNVTPNVSSQAHVSASPASMRPLSPITFHRSLLKKNPDAIELPPEYPGRCSNALQEKIAKLYEKKVREGKNMNDSIQRRKDFRNPSIYEKLISYCGIDELGTNYPPEIYDPHKWGAESFYDELGKRQKEEMEKREKEKKEKTKVEFISGTARKPTIDLTDNNKRKSKWDVGIPQSGLLHASLKPATLVNPVVPIAAPSGTKPTVISAFGTITKKGKQ